MLSPHVGEKTRRKSRRRMYISLQSIHLFFKHPRATRQTSDGPLSTKAQDANLSREPLFAGIHFVFFTRNKGSFFRMTANRIVTLEPEQQHTRASAHLDSSFSLDTHRHLPKLSQAHAEVRIRVALVEVCVDILSQYVRVLRTQDFICKQANSDNNCLSSNIQN